MRIMDNIGDAQKKEIDYLHETIYGLKKEILHIAETLQYLDQHPPDPETLGRIVLAFSQGVFTVEDVGKRAGALFANKALYKDSSELAKFLHQTALKAEALKEAYLAKDKAAYAKYLSSLKRTMASAEYVLSLFIGELSSEITSAVFAPEIQAKKAGDVIARIDELSLAIESLTTRLGVCEQRLSLVIQKHPEDVLEQDEAVVLKAIQQLHDENVAWVEPRFIEKALSLPRDRIEQVVDGLARFGLLETKMRGGTKVFKYGEQHDFNTN